MKNVKEYYKLLGKMAYSVAIADGAIQTEEREKLRQRLLSEFALNEPNFDSSGMNKAFYVDFEFEESKQNLPDVNETMKSFTDFIELNYENTDHDLLQRSVKLLQDISNAYSKRKEKTIIDTIQNKINSVIYI